jgi:hypothetical protein
MFLRVRRQYPYQGKRLGDPLARTPTLILDDRAGNNTRLLSMIPREILPWLRMHEQSPPESAGHDADPF